MFSRLLVFLMLLAVTTAQASIYKTEIVEYIDEAKVVAFISEADIEKSAQWDPVAQKVPLEISGVVDIIRKQAASEKQGGKLSILEIELKQIPRHKGYWHYLVRTRLEHPERTETGFFIVLMDGQLIPAMREPESIK